MTWLRVAAHASGHPLARINIPANLIAVENDDQAPYTSVGADRIGFSVAAQAGNISEFVAQRERVPAGSGTAKALDYSFKRWAALTRYLEDDAVLIDINQIENLIRP